VGVEQRAAEEPDHQTGRGGTDGRTDRVPSSGLPHGRPASLLLLGRHRSGCGCGILGFRIVRLRCGDAIGLVDVVGVVVVGRIVLRAFVVGHENSFVVGT
jgi:hypothetical protein